MGQFIPNQSITYKSNKYPKKKKAKKIIENERVLTQISKISFFCCKNSQLLCLVSVHTAADRVLPGLIPFAKVKASCMYY